MENRINIKFLKFFPLLFIFYSLVSLKLEAQVISFTHGSGGKLISESYVNEFSLSASSSGTFCENGLITLSASGAVSYDWSNGQSIPSFSYLAQVGDTIFKVTGTNENGCSDSVSITVSVPPSPVLQSVSGPLVVQALNEYNYTVQPNTPGWTYTWEVNGGIISSAINSSTVGVIWAETAIGTLCVTAYNENGCPSSLVCINVPVGIEELPANQGSMLAYPNPSQGEIQLQLTDRTEWFEQISIYSSNGALVHQVVSGIQQHSSFNLSIEQSFAPGLYQIVAKTNKRLHQQKIILQH